MHLYTMPRAAFVTWGLSNMPFPKSSPFADLSRAFARSIFLTCATNLLQFPLTSPAFDGFVECSEVLLGFSMVRDLINYVLRT